MQSIKSILTLIKTGIISSVSITALLGYLAYTKTLDPNAIFPVLGIFFLAGASSALNQIQERKFDVLMFRTKHRPLVTEKLSLSFAVFIVLIFTIAGCTFFLIKPNYVALILALTAFFWYNLIYVYLKRITAFAVVPGSVIGAIPPLVGYCFAGGGITDYLIICLSGFYFIWQIPHFWLLQIKFSNDYRIAKFPIIIDVFTEKKVKLLIAIGILISFILAECSIIFILKSQLISIVFLILEVFILIWILIFLYHDKKKPNYAKLYKLYNSFMILFTMSLITILILN